MRYARWLSWLCVFALPVLALAETPPCAPASVVYPLPLALPEAVLLSVAPVVGLRWEMPGLPQLLDVQRRAADAPDTSYQRVATVPGTAYVDGWGLETTQSYCYRVCRPEAELACSNVVCVQLCGEEN